MSKEDLNKSIDAMIDELFAEDSDSVEKSIDVSKDSKTKADEVVNQAPKAKDDDKRGAGRPKQISEIPENDKDGKREGKYDESISENEDKEDEPKEVDQVKSSDQTKGGKAEESMAKPMKKVMKKSEEISDEEWAAFKEFKKSQETKAEEEKLAKAKNEQSDLIKSAIMEATESMRQENAELKKSLTDTQELVKAMAERPQRRKSVGGIEAVEKSGSAPKSETFSKSEMLDAAEKLAMEKSIPEFKDNHLIELEQTGFVYDEKARKLLEDHIKNKN